MRYCVSTAVICVVGSSLCPAVEPRSEIYIVHRDPASVTTLRTDTWEPVHSIPIDSGPSAALLHPNRRYLYIVHNGLTPYSRKQARKISSLSIISIPDQTVLGRIPLGWNALDMAITKDGRYLSIWCPGRTDGKRLATTARDAPSVSEPRAGDRAYLIVVKPGEGHSFVAIDLGPAGSQGQLFGDPPYIIALAYPELQKRPQELKSLLESRLLPAAGLEAGEKSIHQVRTAPRRTSAEVRFFYPPFQRDAAPTGRVKLESWPDQMLVSRDQRWLYVFDFGVVSKKKRRFHEAKAYVVDLKSETLLATHNLGAAAGTIAADPSSGEVIVPAWSSPHTPKTRLHRFRGSDRLDPIESEILEPYWIHLPEGSRERFVVARNHICRWPIGSLSFSACISLEEVRGETRRPLIENPGWLLYLPQRERLVVASSPIAEDLGVIDLRTNRFVRTLTTGRGGVKFAKGLGAAALSGVLSLAYTSATRGDLAVSVAVDVPVTRPTQLRDIITARGDGQFVYAYNGLSDDVTIVDTDAGNVIDKIGVGPGCRAFGLGPAGRLLWAACGSQVTVINTLTNKKEHQYFLKGLVNDLFVLESMSRIIVLTTRSVAVYDAESGRLVKEIENRSDPIRIVAPIGDEIPGP